MKIRTTIQLLRDIQNKIRHYIYVHPYADDLYFSELIAEAYLPDAIDALEKYRWHDLRKDPKDLPNKCKMYIVCIEHPSEEKEVGVGYYKNMHGYGGWIALIPNDGNVIAWKEIEPFEE